jgi:hypothetical protein
MVTHAKIFDVISLHIQLEHFLYAADLTLNCISPE